MTPSRKQLPIPFSAIFIVWVIVWAGLIGFAPTTQSTIAQETSPSKNQLDQLRTANNLADAFKYVAKKLKPSVVSISTQSRPRNVRVVPRMPVPQMPFGFSPFHHDEIFRQFPSFDVPRSIPGEKGFGSGVIVRKDGHILTNHHVIEGAEKIKVTLSDERTFSAKVVGSDPESDLAIIKIEEDELQPVTWGNADSVEVGEWVVAVGNPFGLNQTVTSGIISAVGRDGTGITGIGNFIQTDAAINPGNSGGPLVNLKGELLGINTAIASRDGNFNGIGFAIPSTMAKRVTSSIIKHGRVSHGKLGAKMQNLNKDLAQALNYSGEGVLIREVARDGAGAVGGLKKGDIVTGVNGKPIRSSSQLRGLIATLNPDTTLRLNVIRKGRETSLRFKLSDRAKPMDRKSGVAVTPGAKSSVGAALGFSVGEMTDEVREKVGVREGVVITSVKPNTRASRTGITSGSVLIQFNGKSIKSLDDFKEASEGASWSKGIRLRLLTEGGGTKSIFARGL